MNKIKTPLEIMIYEGACDCFEPADYSISKERPYLSYGHEIIEWFKEGKLSDHRKIRELYQEAYRYIEKHNIKESLFDFGLLEGITNNKHALELSIIGNRMEEIRFSRMTDEEQWDHFYHNQFYYNLDYIRETIKFAQDKLVSLERVN